MLGRSRTRFWRPLRAIPITLMALVLAATLLYQNLPDVLLRAWFYPVRYEDTIEVASSAYRLDPYLVAAMIKCESNWDEQAKSDAGAEGLMQMMPETARDLAKRGYIDAVSWSADNLFDPQTNIMYGCCYLSTLLKQGDSEQEAIAAYNAGPSAASSWADQAKAFVEGSFVDAIQYPETKSYVKRVEHAKAKYASLYPEGFTS